MLPQSKQWPTKSVLVGYARTVLVPYCGSWYIRTYVIRVLPRCMGRTSWRTHVTRAPVTILFVNGSIEPPSQGLALSLKYQQAGNGCQLACLQFTHTHEGIGLMPILHESRSRKLDILPSDDDGVPCPTWGPYTRRSNDTSMWDRVRTFTRGGMLCDLTPVVAPYSFGVSMKKADYPLLLGDVLRYFGPRNDEPFFYEPPEHRTSDCSTTSNQMSHCLPLGCSLCP